MDIEQDSGTEGSPAAAASQELLPVRFRREAVAAAKADPLRGMLPAKQLKTYYLHGLNAVFQPGVSLPDSLRVAEKFSGEEVLLLYPGPAAVEVEEIIRQLPEIKCLHIVESCEANLETIRAGLRVLAQAQTLPELAGYVTDLSHLPGELAGRCGLAVMVNVVDPKADKWFRQDGAQQISRTLKLGGVFYSAGETVRWTDEVTPLGLVPIPVEPEQLTRAGHSDALPRPMFYLKRLPEAQATLAEEEALRAWWKRGLALFAPDATDDTRFVVKAPFVPRVEDGRGEPNAAPWNFLITKPAVRRPAMDWTPRAGDPFGNLTLGTLLQFNSHTGMYVLRVQDCPDVVLKITKPFEGDIPDDPSEWNKLRKSKTLKRENQALRLLKGLHFIPQHVAHGYDPVTGWYAIVVEHEPSRPLSELLILQHNRRRRHHESPAEADQALDLVKMILNALAIVHDQGLVHLDLKPAHVFLRPDSTEAVLIDWGVARKIDEPLADDRRSVSWLHAAPERTDLKVPAVAAVHHDLYSVGVMLLQLASDWDLNGHPQFLLEYFLKHGRMPLATELEAKLRPHWKWAAPVIARAISSRKDAPGYADHRYTSAREMAEDIARHHVQGLSLE